MRHARSWLCALSLFAFAAPAAWGGALDGEKFRVKLVNVKSEKSWRHRLVFNAGSFESLECRKHGFAKSAYDSDGATFTATAKSEKGGTAVWKGTLAGRKIEGTLEWTRPGAAQATQYRFVGKRIGKKKAKR